MGRPDGKKLKHTDPMYRVAVHMMPRRSDAMNAITLNIPYEPIREYVREKKKQGISMSNMTVILAGLVRLTAEYPAINRFVMNKRVYSREKISVSIRRETFSRKMNGKPFTETEMRTIQGIFGWKQIEGEEI